MKREEKRVDERFADKADTDKTARMRLDEDFSEDETDLDAASEGTRVSFTVESSDRLDKLVSAACGISRSAAAQRIDEENVTVNGKAAVKSTKPALGDTVEVFLPPDIPCETQPQNIPIDIVYEDDDLLIVNKPRGMVVHPAPGNPDGTLVNALLYHCGDRLSGINGVIRPGIVHRIDKDTSGLLIVAKNDEAHKNLALQIKEHSFDRIYNAIVSGNVREDEGVIDLPIGRHPKDRKKMTVTEKNSRRAVTHYKVIERFAGYTFLELKLETGRTHQIRVHTAHTGHAVLGDPLYAPNGGKNPFGLSGQCLHARFIGFIHPRSGKYVSFDSELPDYFTRILEILRKKSQQ